mmetsp:Transcript_60362/g.83923  ORF Transcript_60362/g.83923 Transcript_60362/m.83923 type:complete len:171 (-) Transcript_60362:78-590(-)
MTIALNPKPSASRTEYGSVKRRYLAALGFRPSGDTSKEPSTRPVPESLHAAMGLPNAPREGTPPCAIPMRRNSSQHSLRSSMDCCFLMDEEELGEPDEEFAPISQSCPIAVPELVSNRDEDGETIGLGHLTSSAWDSEEDFIPPHLLVSNDSSFSVYEFRRKKKATEYAF